MTNDGSVSLLVAFISRSELLIPILLHALAHSTTTAGSDVAGRVAVQLTFERRERVGRQSLG